MDGMDVYNLHSYHFSCVGSCDGFILAVRV